MGSKTLFIAVFIRPEQVVHFLLCMAWIWRQQRPMAEASRHVFGDTPITEASIGAAPPDILVKLSDLYLHRRFFVGDE